MSNDTNSSAICFLSGLALAAMGYSLHSHYEYLQEQQQSTKIKLRKGKLKKGERLEDAIPLKSLAYLIQSNNASIQNNSVEIIIGRAMSKETLSYIITTCQKDQPIEIRSKALTALQLLTQKKKHRPTLLEQGALSVLVEALASNEEEMKEITQRNVAMAICDLIQENDINKYCVIEMGILDSIQRILTSTTIKNNELKYWTLMILHQISLSEPFPKVLVHQGFVGLLAKMARMTFGNTNMPKFCMQSLVRLVASVDTIESKTVLIELLDYNIVDLISICLRADDVELIYWAAGLMHEFVLKDVASDQFRSIQGIHTILAGLLSADEMYISRVILRTVKFMAYGHESFRQGMVKTNIVKKIMHCLSLEDDDVRYWAILCIHAVAGQVESHSDILNAPEFKILLELAVSRKVHAALFVADILSLICCIWQNDIAMEKHIELLATTLEDLLTWNEVEVQYNSAGAIFNLVSMRNSFAAVVKEKCIDGILSLSIYSAHERVQLTSAKTSLSLTIKYPSLKPKLISEVVEPLINTCITINRPFIPLIVMQIIANTTDQSDSTKIASNTILEEDEVFTPNYVNVNPNGAISSEYRLGRLLQGAQQQQNNNLFNQSQRNMNRRRNRQRRRRRRNQRVALLEQFSTSSSNSSLNDDDTDDNEEDEEDHEGGNRNREMDDDDEVDNEDDDDYDEEYVKKTKLTGSELLSNLSLFFEQSLNDRIQILKEFQLPTTVHTQLSGSLCALRHLLENDKIMDDVISGAFFQSSTAASVTTTTSNCATIRTPPSLQEQIRYILSSDDEDDFTTFGIEDVDDDNEVEDEDQVNVTYNYRMKKKKKFGEASSNYTSKPVCCDHKNYPLTDKVRQLVDSLIYQSLFPIIGQWWEAIGHQQHDIEKICMNEENAIQVYHDVLNWIHMITCLTTQQHSNYYYEASLPNPSSTTTTNIPNINTFHSDFEWSPYDDEKNKKNATTTNEKKAKIQPINTSTPLMKIYFGFASRSLLLLKSLLRYESIRCYLIYNMHFIELMIYMFQYFPNLTDQILTCLGAMIDTDIIIPEASLQRLVIAIWKNLLDPTMVQKSKKTFEFYTTLILTCGSRMMSQQQQLDTGRHQRSKKQKGNDDGFVELDINTCTSFCIMNEETLLDVRNDTWTFETIRSTFAVQKQNNNNNNKFCYEIILKTDGLIQIGWMNALTQIDAEAGSGVGDDEYSYGYDGYRCKKWHGRHRVRKSSYGKSWALGDIITCAIDLDQGEIRYYQNGYDLGTAFTKVDTTKEWFPAASLSTGQGCEFLFGSPLDRLHYPPEGYQSIYDLLQLSTTDKVGPNTQLKQNSMNELSMTMENLSIPDDDDEEFDSFYSNTAKINEEDDNNIEYFDEDEDEDESHSDLNNQLMNDQPLLYIEMIIAHRQQKEKMETDDEDDNNSNVVIFGLKNAFTTMNNVELVYDHDKKRGTIYHAMTNLTPTSFSMNIEDGSILGLLYYHSTNQFGVSLNGTNLSLVHLPTGSSFLPYLPYVKGNVKTKTNFGQDPFYYSHQLNLLDLETKNMVDYLNLFF